MTWRVLGVSVLLGMLTTFLVCSVSWAEESHATTAFGANGPSVTFRVHAGSSLADQESRHAAVEEVVAWLDQHVITLAVSSVGDGYPYLTVHDPAHGLPWFPGFPESSLPGQQVYVFDRTYSAELAAKGRANPLLPSGAKMIGVIDPPNGTGDLQGALSVGEAELPTGNYLLTTDDPELIAEFQALLTKENLVSTEVGHSGIRDFLRREPLIVVSACMVAGGTVCVAAYWGLAIRNRRSAFRTRWRHGARVGTQLVGREWLTRFLPAVGGAFAGAFTVTWVTAHLSREPIGAAEPGRAVQGAVVAALLILLVYLLVLLVSARQWKGDRDDH